MSIFGSFHEISFADLYPVLTARSGALEVFRLRRRPAVTLFMSTARLSCVYEGGRQVDAQRARTVVAYLLRARVGSFEFIPDAAPPRCQHPLEMALEPLLLTTATLVDELSQYRSKLPDAETRFVWKPTRAAYNAEGYLADFASLARLQLKKGASARELSRALEMDLDLVRYYLYKMQESGLLSDSVSLPAAKQAERTLHGTGLIERLLGALKARFR